MLLSAVKGSRWINKELKHSWDWSFTKDLKNSADHARAEAKHFIGTYKGHAADKKVQGSTFSGEHMKLSVP